MISYFKAETSLRFFYGNPRFSEDLEFVIREKAFLDLIYIRHIKRKELRVNAIKSPVNDMYLDELDFEKLQEYSEKFSPTTRKIISEIRSLEK